MIPFISERMKYVISNPQQTDITNNVIETSTQTTNCIGETYLNNNKIATVILNSTPSLSEIIYGFLRLAIMLSLGYIH